MLLKGEKMKRWIGRIMLILPIITTIIIITQIVAITSKILIYDILIPVGIIVFIIGWVYVAFKLMEKK